MTPLLCACAVMITLETQKCRKGHLTPSTLSFLLVAIDGNSFCRMKEEGQIYKTFSPPIFWQRFVAMNMMKKCAKLHKDSLRDKKVKLNLASAIELSETAIFCVQLCIETLSKRATSVAHLTNFSFEFFYNIFTEDAALLLLYHGAKSQIWPKTQIKESCLKCKNACYRFYIWLDLHLNLAISQRLTFSLFTPSLQYVHDGPCMTYQQMLQALYPWQEPRWKHRTSENQAALNV